MEESQTATPAPIRNRILAMVYDGLIILFLSTIVVLVIQLAIVGDEQIPTDHISNKIFKILWFVPGLLYLGYYWTKSGQTPSMKIWKIKLVNQQGLIINWKQALIRYVTALLGLGLMVALFNKKRLQLRIF